jgi:hypothetical protein
MNNHKIISAVLEDLEGVEFFIGGSQRFGYNTPFSDLDLFIFVPPTTDPELALEFLETGKANGYKQIVKRFGVDERQTKNLSNKKLYDIGNTYHFKCPFLEFRTIDLLLFENYETWDELRKEHEEVEKIYQDSPKLSKVIKNMVGPGKYKYQAIIKGYEIDGPTMRQLNKIPKEVNSLLK